MNDPNSAELALRDDRRIFSGLIALTVVSWVAFGLLQIWWLPMQITRFNEVAIALPDVTIFFLKINRLLTPESWFIAILELMGLLALAFILFHYFPQRKIRRVVVVAWILLFVLVPVGLTVGYYLTVQLVNRSLDDSLQK